MHVTAVAHVPSALRSLAVRLRPVQIVGRLAVNIVPLLMGKHKPVFRADKDFGDYVVVVNAKHVTFTGSKMKHKLYRWHTGYPGGLKSTTPERLLVKQPEEVLRRAVWGMLPKNNLRKSRAKKLRIFADDEHPFLEELAGAKPLMFYNKTMPLPNLFDFNPHRYRVFEKPEDYSQLEVAMEIGGEGLKELDLPHHWSD